MHDGHSHNSVYRAAEKVSTEQQRAPPEKEKEKAASTEQRAPPEIQKQPQEVGL